MSLDPSLKSASSLVRHRNVLTRDERLARLKDEEKWTAGRSVFGLPKVANRKANVGKAEKEETAEGAEGATPAAGAAPAAKGAAPAAKGAAPAAKGAAPAKAPAAPGAKGGAGATAAPAKKK
jgi:small basic protein (TIGR04137 family)